MKLEYYLTIKGVNNCCFFIFCVTSKSVCKKIVDGKNLKPFCEVTCKKQISLYLVINKKNN